MAAPSKLTAENRLKLQEAAALDASVEEMAYYCGVSHQTIYNWFENDVKLFEEIQRLREKPVLLARQTVVKGIKDSYSNAMNYLERKRKKEFAQRIEQTGADGKPLTITFDNAFTSEAKRNSSE